MDASWVIFAEIDSPPESGTYLLIEKLSLEDFIVKFCIVPSDHIVFLYDGVPMIDSMFAPRKSVFVISTPVSVVLLNIAPAKLAPLRSA